MNQSSAGPAITGKQPRLAARAGRRLLATDAPACATAGVVIYWLWSLLSLINRVRDVHLTALLVRQRFKQTARLVAITAVVSIVTMWFALERLAAPGALVGLAWARRFFCWEY